MPPPLHPTSLSFMAFTLRSLQHAARHVHLQQDANEPPMYAPASRSPAVAQRSLARPTPSGTEWGCRRVNAGHRRYMVIDSLRISNITLLNTFAVADFSALQEKIVQIGYKDVIKINLPDCFLGWFIPGSYNYDDLKDMMFDNISESFNADFEDGTIGEVRIFESILHDEYGEVMNIQVLVVAERVNQFTHCI
ncbi:hypothetical protein VPH35_051990 [Triticum aestivum]|uniref:Uncharacterized protein n=1 Tax=Triticum aestivum TaxID=4565 RepID=A0A077S190_WHEAT|nr:unnamed protein product [Triticum aestivum]